MIIEMDVKLQQYGFKMNCGNTVYFFILNIPIKKDKKCNNIEIYVII